jgi:ferric-dicitrate binding protein FerR (iron transport regulator)
MKAPRQKYQEIMVRFLAGECSAEEEAMMLEWIGQSAENKASFEQYRKVWELHPPESSAVFDTAVAWKKV